MSVPSLVTFSEDLSMISNIFRSVLLSAAFAASFAATAKDEIFLNAPVLTFAGALQLAATHSRLMEAGLSQAAAAREMAVAAGQLPDPILKLGINNLPINGEDRLSLSKDFMTMRSVGVMQELTREAKRNARALRFDKEAETATANRTLTLANLQRATALAWFDRYYQERIVELLQRQRSEIKLQIDAAEAVYRGGRGSLSDVYAVRSALVQMDDRIAQSERLVTTAIVQLTRWIGDAAAHPLGSPPEMTRVNIGDANLEAQLQHHPQITVMAAQENTALADAELARANKQADWTVELMVNQRGAAYSNMVSINASVPLQWNPASRQDRELAAKLATVAQLRAEREDAVRAHVAEVRSMLQEWQNNRARLRRYDDAMLPLATERARAALATYRGGATTGGTLSAVLEARRSEIDIHTDRLRLEMDTARLWAQLNYLTPVSGH